MCSKCSCRFTTYERIERPQLIVIKNNQVREIFNREKLIAGLYRACEKTSVSSLELEQLVSDVESKLYELNDSEVTTAKIGELVMEQLSGLNEVAYVRFASVYRRFKDIASFEKELSDIRKKKDTS
jgi:transcriptional repressor NrdR